MQYRYYVLYRLVSVVSYLPQYTHGRAWWHMSAERLLLKQACEGRSYLPTGAKDDHARSHICIILDSDE